MGMESPTIAACKLGAQDTKGVGSSPRAEGAPARLEASQAERAKLLPPPVCSTQASQTGRGPHADEAPALLCPLVQMLISSRNTLRHTHKHVQPNLWAPRGPPQDDT